MNKQLADMIKNILLYSPILFFLISCSQSEIEVAEKRERLVTIEIGQSEVVKLDGKEIHSSFLETQMAELAKDFELTTEVKVDSGAMVGTVADVTQAIKNHTDRYITHPRAILK